MRWSMFDGDAQHALLEARRRAMAAGTPMIASAQLLAACLGDPSVGRVMARAGIDPDEASARLGASPTLARTDLLALVGIDLDAVRQALPTNAPMPWRLRRWATRPLRITLEAPSSSVRFAGSGRKVLEVALWNAKRHHRLASSLDLLRGVVSDGRDPINAHLAPDERTARRLFVCLAELDEAHV